MKTAALLLLGAFVLSACDEEDPGQKKIGVEIAQWASQPEGEASVVGEFRKDFPNAWSKMLSGLKVNYGNANDVKAAQADALNQVTVFIKAHFDDMAKAPDADLDALFDEQRALLNNVWSVNVETCAHVASDGLRNGDDVGKYGADAFADKRLQLKTMADATAHPTTHSPFAWTPAEKAQLDVKFKKDNIVIPKQGMLGADYIVQCVAKVDTDEMVKSFAPGRKADFEADDITKRAAAAS